MNGSVRNCSVEQSIGPTVEMWYSSLIGRRCAHKAFAANAAYQEPLSTLKNAWKGVFVLRCQWHKVAMKKHVLTVAAAISLSTAAIGQIGTEPPPPLPSEAMSPNEIVANASPEEWVVIDAEDLLVMTLAPDRDGNERSVVIQLLPAPFSQGWVENIRTLARSGWYDGISVNRVQDNYVVQWGDPGHDNPEGEGIETKSLPDGLNVMDEEGYLVSNGNADGQKVFDEASKRYQSAALHTATLRPAGQAETFDDLKELATAATANALVLLEPYGSLSMPYDGWPIGVNRQGSWPIHCYGMVGVGRNFSPDTGSGAELYTVIGHAPRHLDRNIALAGRIIDGMEHLSSLRRGSGVLGFYTEEEAGLRTPIVSIRVASDLPEGERPQFEYLSTEGETFAKYADARANRRDPFFIVPAGGADICNIPVPVRAIGDG